MFLYLALLFQTKMMNEGVMIKDISNTCIGKTQLTCEKYFFVLRTQFNYLESITKTPISKRINKTKKKIFQKEYGLFPDIVPVWPLM